MTPVGCCRLWLDEAHSPALNMAIDEVLLNRACDLGPVVRFYGWTDAALTIGYFQPWSTAPAGLHIVIRRPTGGGVVDHLNDVTFSLAVPRGHALFEVDRFVSYQWINQAVCEAVCELGATATLSDCTAEVADRRHLVCFDSPARHDVVSAAGKICGGAQRRAAGGMLLQSSIDRGTLPGVDRQAIVARVSAAVTAVLGGRTLPFEASPECMTEAVALAKNKYETTAWNQKR